MIRLICAAALAILAFQLPAAAAPSQASAALMPVQGFINFTNKGKMKSAAAEFTPNATMTDEFAPFHWQGPHVFDQWLASYGKMAKAAGMTDPVMSTMKPTTLEIRGDAAYAVIPAAFAYKQKGATRHQTGTMTFALTRTKQGWRIQTFTWSLSSGS